MQWQPANGELESALDTTVPHLDYAPINEPLKNLIRAELCSVSRGRPGTTIVSRSLAGKPLDPFPADKRRRITVLYGMVAYDKRLRKPTKHRQTTLRK